MLDNKLVPAIITLLVGTFGIIINVPIIVLLSGILLILLEIWE
jgi:hypothetical protein